LSFSMVTVLFALKLVVGGVFFGGGVAFEMIFEIRRYFPWEELELGLDGYWLGERDFRLALETMARACAIAGCSIVYQQHHKNTSLKSIRHKILDVSNNGDAVVPSSFPVLRPAHRLVPRRQDGFSRYLDPFILSAKTL